MDNPFHPKQKGSFDSEQQLELGDKPHTMASYLKRQGSDDGPTNWTTDQVCQWLDEIIEQGQLGILNGAERVQIIQQFKENDIDGNALQTLPNDEHEYCLLIKKAGIRIKLKKNIDELFQGISSPKFRKRSQGEQFAGVDDADKSRSYLSTVFRDELDFLITAKESQDEAINAIVSCASEITDALKPNLGMQRSISEVEKLLEMQNENMYSTLVVVGDTGSGKSSLLNALLRESELLPTNGSGNACTGENILIVSKTRHKLTC
jgi:hypothetical protein